MIHIVKIDHSKGMLGLVQPKKRDTVKNLSPNGWHSQRGRLPKVAINCSLFDTGTMDAKPYGTVYHDKGFTVNPQHPEQNHKYWIDMKYDNVNGFVVDGKIDADTWLCFSGFACLKNGNRDTRKWDLHSHLAHKEPRTVIGQSADSIVIMVTDGRPDGLTAKECQDIMLSEGCTDAIILDGGGSSTLMINNIMVNKNENRKVANALVFYAKEDYKPIYKEFKPMKVCIDMGHATTTSGKRTPLYDDSSYIKECEQNYPIGFKLAKILQHNNINTLFTNINIDYDMPLKDRAFIEKSSNADVFVSIHKNASPTYDWNNIKGTETYCYKFGGEGERLARLVHKHIISDSKDKDRSVKEGNFYMIRETKAPAILCEMGFMTNKEDASKMKDPKWHLIYAEAIAKGICEYFGVEYKEMEKITNPSSGNIDNNDNNDGVGDSDNNEQIVSNNGELISNKITEIEALLKELKELISER